jgi:hypothetical protein
MKQKGQGKSCRPAGSAFQAWTNRSMIVSGHPRRRIASVSCGRKSGIRGSGTAMLRVHANRRVDAS